MEKPLTTAIDPQAVMAIHHLELRARFVVEGFWNGLHRSPFHGFSVEFTEYRQYATGDDTRFLDWRLFGRTDRYYIKKFEDETNLRCYFVVDQSLSMSFGTLGYSKAQYAATLAASLGYFLELQGDAIGLLTFAENTREFLPARNRPGHLRRFMLLAEKLPKSGGTNLPVALERISQLLRKRGLIIVISDFLSPLEALEKQLAQLRAWGQEIALLQILDPAEINLAFDRSTLFRDLENDQEFYIDPVLARAEYKKRLTAHTQTLAELCRKLGVTHYQVPTSQSFQQTLLTFLLDRRRFGKSTRRRASVR